MFSNSGQGQCRTATPDGHCKRSRLRFALTPTPTRETVMSRIRLHPLALVLSLAVVFALPVSRAEANEVPMALTVRNSTDNYVSLHWVNHQGNLQFYKSLGPRQSYVQPTYSSHKWIATFEGTGVQRTF